VKQALVLVLLGAIAVVVIDVLGDATQTRPDPQRPRSRTELVFRVQTVEPRLPALGAAQALWGACQGTAPRTVLEPGLTEVGDGRFRLVVQPALGRHARDRMTGCLEDVTLDRIKGKVVSMRELPPTPK
jgi:hypothetical protein